VIARIVLPKARASGLFFDSVSMKSHFRESPAKPDAEDFISPEHGRDMLG
jgi:hypothetical protein